MSYFFQKKFLFLFFLVAFSLNINAQQTIKEKHIPNYIIDCLEYWFYPNHKNSQLSRLAKTITTEILKSSNYYHEWNWSSLTYENVYSLDYVEQMLRGAIIQFVTENSYNYALEITSIENARKIASYINNYLFNYCSQTAILAQGIFAGCIGYDLRNWVIQIYNQSMQTYKPTTQKYYPSSNCYVCLEDFSDVARVFMTPCGHDICTACATRWFFRENKDTCPCCRQRIDKNALDVAINKSAYVLERFASDVYHC